MTIASLSLDEALARLVAIRIEIERHEVDVWVLERDADELKARVRLLNAQSTAKPSKFVSAVASP